MLGNDNGDWTPETRAFANSFSPVRARMGDGPAAGRVCAYRRKRPARGLVPAPRTTVSTGRSSGLRVLTLSRQPSRGFPQWRSKPGPLAEHSSGPAPDSHRLPFEFPLPELAWGRPVEIPS